MFPLISDATMAACEPSISLPSSGGAAAASSRLRLWPVFSTAAFRRKLLDALMCGGGGAARRNDVAGAAAPISPDLGRNHLRHGSDRLSELMKADAASDSGSDDAAALAVAADAKTKLKIEALEELQLVAKRLQPEAAVAGNAGVDRRRDAAAEVRRLSKDDPKARETLAMLGVIPPLVGVLDSDPGDAELQIAALYALLNLGIGNDLNKAAIVKAGAVHKMLALIEFGSSPPAVSEAIVANFLGLSALDSNKLIIGSSGAIPYLVNSFRDPNPSSPQARQDALRALVNLSIAPSNIPHLVESDIVTCLLSALGDMEVSERVLTVLSNLLSAAEGRRAVSRAGDALSILIDVLNWSDAPGCQEKAAYILMLMAHKARSGDRAVMIEAGIVSALLELTLLGSALAQKRASRVLEILTVDKGKQVSEGFGSGGCSGVPAVSAPICSRPLGEGEWKGEVEEEAGMSEERSAVRQLVQQSLQSNMRRIVRRANLPQDFAPSDHFKALAATSTSKSLPF